MGKTIIVNSVFVGGYGFNKGNLPHEMINFFRADDGNFYVYITPYGVVEKGLAINDISAILFVRSVGNSLVEVLAKAVVSENQPKEDFYVQGIELCGKGDKKGKLKENSQWYDPSDSIKYGQKSLREIHHYNAWDNEIFVTMKVSEICFPKKTFFLTHNENVITPTTQNVFLIQENEHASKQFANQSMKAYFYSDTMPNSFNALQDIIVDKENELWMDSSKTIKYDSSNIKNDNNFFKVTRQQDNEVMFSNMLYYFFSEYPMIAKQFFLKLGVVLNDDFVVEREKERMDVRLISDNIYIIVENKIKSSLNGLQKEKGSNDYKKEGNKYISQLSVYYENAQRKNKSDKINRQIKCFIFVPNYSTITKSFLKNYLYGDLYEIVYYQEIYDFFVEYNKIVELNDRFLMDFVNAMKKHTEPVDNEFRNDLMMRLKLRIDS